MSLMDADDIPDYWRGVDRFPESEADSMSTDRLMLISADGHAGAADRRLPALRRGRHGSTSSRRSSSPARSGAASATAPWVCPRTASWSTPCSARRWSTCGAARTPCGRGARTGVWDSDRRNLELEAEGIVAEVLFPDFQNSNEPPWGAAFPFPDTNPDLRLAGARIFNRWLADFCAAAARPARRCRRRAAPRHRRRRWRRCGGSAPAGLASVMLPTGDSELASYHDTRYDPLWAACVDEGLPVTFHSGGTAVAGVRARGDVGHQAGVHVVGPTPALPAGPRRSLRALPRPRGGVHRAGHRLDPVDARAPRRALRVAVRARHHRRAPTSRRAATGARTATSARRS